MEILGLPLASLITLLVAVLVLLALGFAFMRTLTRWIVKIPSNKALIIVGPGKKSSVPIRSRVRDPNTPDGEVKYIYQTNNAQVNYKIVKGGWDIVVPSIHTTTQLDTGVLTVDVNVENVLTKNAVPISVDGTAQIQIGGDMVFLATAAEKLAGKTPTEVEHVAKLTLQGHLRAIIGQMTVSDLYQDREAFSQEVQNVAVEDLGGLGFVIGSFVINEINDKKGYIDALGAEEIQAKLRDARIAIADANRIAREKEAQQDLAGTTAELERDRLVHQNTEATNLREVAKNLAVELANQNKEREVAEQQALAVEQRKQAEVIVPAEAEAKAKKIIADGERQKIEITAEANAKAAETNARGTANAIKLQADATSEATRKTKTAEADGNKAVLLAEAAGNEAKLLAEAKGRLEIANAVAAQGQVNLIRELALAMITGDVDKAKAFAGAIAGVGEKVSIVQFAGGNEGGSQPNALMGLLQGLPKMGAILNAETKALTGQNIEAFLERALTLVRTAGKMQDGTAVVKPEKTARTNKTADKVEPPATIPVFVSTPVEEPPTTPSEPVKTPKPPRKRGSKE